jgi:hypothetical protein
MGVLPPRYAFILNPFPRERFTRCPRCEAKTRARKIPLVFHVDGFGLMARNTTCRLCVVCDLLIAHQAEIEETIDGLGQSHAESAKRMYLVLGTTESRTWRRAFSGGVTIAELREHMADFKDYLKIEVEPGAWFRPDETAD